MTVTVIEYYSLKQIAEDKDADLDSLLEMAKIELNTGNEVQIKKAKDGYVIYTSNNGFFQR